MRAGRLIVVEVEPPSLKKARLRAFCPPPPRAKNWFEISKTKRAKGMNQSANSSSSLKKARLRAGVEVNPQPQSRLKKARLRGEGHDGEDLGRYVLV